MKILNNKNIAFCTNLLYKLNMNILQLP